MKTMNIYSYPLERKYIKSTISDSPAHRKYHSEEYDADYDLTRAVDFLCDIGTPIKAALDGKVVHVQDGITNHWDKFDIPPKEVMSEDEEDGNYVVIEHGNSELSIYSHQKPNEIQVKKGDRVKEGDILGYSGHNGWSIKPHLHFMVFRFTKPKPARDFESLEIRWK